MTVGNPPVHHSRTIPVSLDRMLKHKVFPLKCDFCRWAIHCSDSVEPTQNTQSKAKLNPIVRLILQRKIPRRQQQIGRVIYKQTSERSYCCARSASCWAHRLSGALTNSHLSKSAAFETRRRGDRSARCVSLFRYENMFPCRASACCSCFIMIAGARMYPFLHQAVKPVHDI